MSRMLALLFLPAWLCAQSAGLTPEWEVKKMLDELVAQTGRLTPILEQVKPDEWTANGAPAGYVDQWKAVRAQIGYVVQTTQELIENPALMNKTLETFLRLQALEAMLDSLSQGVRRYQNPALADLLQAVISDTSASRSRLRGYLVELVAYKQDELRILDLEAQRCRDTLLRPGAKKQR